MPQRTTIGQLLVNEALPEDMRGAHTLDKAGTKALFRELADKYPERYAEIANKLLDVGRKVSTRHARSIRLQDLTQAKASDVRLQQLRADIRGITADRTLTPAQRDKAVIQAASSHLGVLGKDIMDEGLTTDNAMSVYAASGARGGPSQLAQMRGSPLLVSDNKGTVPMPLLHSYSEGLDPAEHFAASYGVRSGFTQIKAGTPKAGFFGKQLANAAHRLIVGDGTPYEGTGLPVDTADTDNEGSVLAHDYGAIKAGTILTPALLRTLSRTHKQILVHSPISAVAPGGSLPALAVGVREHGRMAAPGENVGLAAVSAISEPLAQASISSKHVAGVAGAKGKGGSSAEAGSAFDVMNRLANVPKVFQGAATVAGLDGRVTAVKQAPQGGQYVYVDQERHYVPENVELRVQVGDTLEAGDALSDGVPNPAELVRHKGIGEARRQLLHAMRDTLQAGGVRTHRRNIELATRALINHVQVTSPDGVGDNLPGDIVAYDDLAARYTPRKGATLVTPGHAKGRYLEQPVLHYSVGTRVTPTVMKMLKQHEVQEVMTHEDPPPFEPIMRRAIDTLGEDEDWMVRLGGFRLEHALTDAVHRGAGSSAHSTSYIPALAAGTEFGRDPAGKLPY